MLLRELATRIGAVNCASAPEMAVGTAKLAIMDTIGVTLAGAGSEAAVLVRETIGSTGKTGPSLVFGTQARSDPLDAALVNGTAAHALDFDDCSNTMGGHPSAPVVPAIWALAEARNSGGEAVLTAYIAGMEMETKLGRAVNLHHYEKGWHPTGTLGVFGSAAACARLLELPPAQIAAALGLAASMASGIKANFGTMTKPFHVGQAARNGLLAALLASRGMTANDAALEHRQGFLNVYNGAGTFRPELLLDTWAQPLDLVDPGIGFKRHPCCASTHSAIDAMLALRHGRSLSAGDVVRIDCKLHPRRLGHVDRPNPTTGLEAKFSLQYVLARALLNGIVSMSHFSESAIEDPATRKLMDRISVGSDPDARMDTHEHFYALLTVELASAERLVSNLDRAIGRDHRHPMPEAVLHDKFRDCAGQAPIGGDVAMQVLEHLGRLERLPRIGVISDLLAGSVLSARGSAPQSLSA